MQSSGKYLIIDSREKPHAIEKILAYFDQNGIQHVTSKLLFGDYMFYNNPLLVIDRKQNIAELAKNCTAEHVRFRAELERAKTAGAELVILIEQNTYRNERGETVKVENIRDLIEWSNPHTAVRGERVFRVLASWSKKYAIRAIFCDKRSTGRMIDKILSEGQIGGK